MGDTASFDTYINSPAYLAQQKILHEQSATYLAHAQSRKTINIMGIACSSVNHDDEDPRVPSSTKILMDTLAYAQTMTSTYPIETKQYILDDIEFKHCEANYSMKGHYCTWPCRISQRMSQKWLTDPLTSLYYDLVDRCDIVLLATPIRWGSPSSLYFKLVERLNCIENQKEVYGVDLVHDQLCGGIIIGAQDGAQHVMGTIMSTWSELWFSFAKNPFVAYTAWWLRNQRTDIIPNQLDEEKKLIQAMQHDMLSAQIRMIEQRRAYQSS